MATSSEEKDIKTPVGAAAAAGSVAIMNFLIKQGFSPERKSIDERRNCPIHLACIAGKLQAVKVLVKKHGVDVNVLDAGDYPPVFLAAKNGFLNVVKYLVEEGGDLEYVDQCGQSALHIAAESSAEICEYLISEGMEVNAENQVGQIPLHVAYDNDNTEAVKVLVENGSDIHYVDEFSNTPLSNAIDHQNLEMFKIMISQDPEGPDGNESTPLSQMAYFGLDEWARHLIVDVGVGFEGEDEEGESPFGNAIFKGNLAMARMMIRAGLNPANEEYWTDEEKLETILNKDGGKEFIEEVKYLATNPRSLIDLACFKVRDLIGYYPEEGIETLSLPENLKDYLLFKHV